MIHRNPAASGLFVQAVLTRCETQSSASFVGQLVHCLEGIHPAQCGSLLALLVEKVLATPHVALARTCEALAQRQVQLMLSEPAAVLHDLAGLPQLMRSTRLHRRCILELAPVLSFLTAWMRVCACDKSKEGNE